MPTEVIKSRVRGTVASCNCATRVTELERIVALLQEKFNAHEADLHRQENINTVLEQMGILAPATLPAPDGGLNA